MSDQQQHRSTTTTTSYKTEMQVPVRRDNQTFEERQKTMWGEMNERMERRRREWEEEVDQLRSDFFRLKPDETARRGSGENLLEKMDLNSMFYDTGNGTKLFRVSFDVSQFEPHEISVRAQNQNLIVHAKHEETGSEKNVSREFSRQVVIPSNVNPETLRSTLSNDGILQVEADLPAPAYDQLRDDRTPRVQGATGPRDLIYPGQAAAAAAAPTGNEGSKLFQLMVDIGSDFLPQDLTVKTVDRKLVVHARHEEKAPGRSSCRQFNREFEIPEGVDPNLVTASLAPGGKLVLEAPLVRPPPGPVTGSVAGSQQKQSVINVSHGGN